MGNDGGVIAVKRKFMRHGNQKAREARADPDAARQDRARLCAISGEPLRAPIVACALGNLFNKVALLEQLLAKTMPARFQHITSLKDVVNCKFYKREGGAAPPAAANGSSEAGATTKAWTSDFQCPVTMVEFNGSHPFVVVAPCGCVVSERSMKEVQSDECLACGKPIDRANLIALLPPEETYADAQKVLMDRKAAERAVKKAGKTSKKRPQEAEAAGHDKKKSKKQDQQAKASSSGSNGTAPAGASNIAQEAAAAVEQAKQKNDVFSSLFGPGQTDRKKTANDLLMGGGGLRYTLS